MKHAWLPLLAAFAALAQQPGYPPDLSLPPIHPRNPGARQRQQTALSKEDFKNNTRDAEELVKLSQELQASIAKNGSFIVDANDLRTTDEIEKLAKRIHRRLNSF